MEVLSDIVYLQDQPNYPNPAHQTARVPPPRYHSVHKIEEQADWHRSSSGPGVSNGIRRARYYRIAQTINMKPQKLALGH